LTSSARQVSSSCVYNSANGVVTEYTSEVKKKLALALNTEGISFDVSEGLSDVTTYHLENENLEHSVRLPVQEKKVIDPAEARKKLEPGQWRGLR